MRLFSFDDPRDFRFASAVTRGTFVDLKGVCPGCGAPKQRRIQPLIMEWEPESDLIGDFVWLSWGSDVAVVHRAMVALGDRFRGFEPGRVEMVQDPRLKRPTRVTKRTKPRVWLPYEGPSLFDFWVTAWAHADMGMSTVRLVKECNVCGRRVHGVSGIERRRSTWDPESKDLVETRYPRVPGQGVFVRRNELRGADIFHIYELPGFIMCTEPVKEFIEKEGFTAVRFDEMGDVVE